MCEKIDAVEGLVFGRFRHFRNDELKLKRLVLQVKNAAEYQEELSNQVLSVIFCDHRLCIGETGLFEFIRFDKIAYLGR